MPAHHLSHRLPRAAATWPDHPAVEDERGRSWTYAELEHEAERLATWLCRRGMGRGDLVGLFLPKCLEGVAAIHGILRAGAAYVPTDPTAPASRAAGILRDAGVKAIIVAAEMAGALADSWEGPLPSLVVVGKPGPLAATESWDAIRDDAPSPSLPEGSPDDLAYVLYTSGSTGRPKGVMLSHANANCFLDWCAATFELRPGDRFGSHAPFHFDLSVFDLFASCETGGTLVLVGEALGKEPARLGAFLARSRLDVWYSAPSILALLTDYGGIDAPGFPAPRLVLFAGEVFPIRPLRRLRRLWPTTTFWNLYGPTETNVCTAYRIPAEVPDARCESYPIGSVCPPLRARVVDELGSDVSPGIEGELLIAGAGVMRGYLGRPDLNAQAFQIGEDGTPWYRTGDRVIDDGTGCFRFQGRRDRMVKRRGCRIELGEIEAALACHDDVERVAVVARSDDQGVSLAAFLTLRPGRKGSLIALKRHCAGILPTYMVPDTIAFLPALPRTSTDKVDYPALARLIEARGEAIHGD